MKLLDEVCPSALNGKCNTEAGSIRPLGHISLPKFELSEHRTFHVISVLPIVNR